MHLIPTQGEVLDLLRQFGALRSGNFQYPDGFYSDQHLQLPLILRFYEQANTLAVALSRLVRQNPELRAAMSQLSLVTPSPNGLPIAYAMCETLKVKQVYWAESSASGELQFPQYVEPAKGERVLMVDDIYRTGRRLRKLRTLLEGYGAKVEGVAVLIKHPAPHAEPLEDLPMYCLASLNVMQESEKKPGIPLEEVRI